MGAMVGTMVGVATGAAVENRTDAERRKDDDANNALMASTSVRPRRSAGEADVGRRGKSSALRRSTSTENQGRRTLDGPCPPGAPRGGRGRARERARREPETPPEALLCG